MRWFRLYDEMLDDHKVQSLSPELFKTWINLLAVASREGGILPPVEKLAFALRVSKHEMQSRLEDLVLVGLIDIRKDGRHEPHNWLSRQWKSDDSSARVRKHRATKRKCNGDVTVTVTPPEAEAEAESETEAEAKAPENFDWRSALAKRGVSPRLLELAEGFGLPVEAMRLRAEAADVKSPDAMFRHLAVAELRAKLPIAPPDTLKAAFTVGGDAARGLVYQLLVEVEA